MTDENIQEHGYRALAHIAKNDENAKSSVALGGIHVVAEAIRHRRDDAGCGCATMRLF